MKFHSTGNTVTLLSTTPTGEHSHVPCSCQSPDLGWLHVHQAHHSAADVNTAAELSETAKFSLILQCERETATSTSRIPDSRNCLSETAPTVLSRRHWLLDTTVFVSCCNFHIVVHSVSLKFGFFGVHHQLIVSIDDIISYVMYSL